MATAVFPQASFITFSRSACTFSRSLYEGYYSKDPDSYEQLLNDLLIDVSMLGIEEESCKIFVKERSRLRKAKKTIGDFDQ